MPALSQRLASLAAILACLVSAHAGASGGDGFQRNRFASEFQPAHIELFAAGKLGVLPGSYWRIYHYLAYQAAMGRPLSKEQVARLGLVEWHVGAAGGAKPEDRPDDLPGWQAARKPFAIQFGLDPEPKQGYMGETADSESYLNCHSDAFTKAGATLAARAGLGKPDAWLKAWLQGQDAVFANCEEPPYTYGQPRPKRVVQLPPALAAGAPDWLKYDRAYQNAAAHFYARNFDLARSQFQDIARQPKSPWQALGGYLAARTLIRKAVLDYPLAAGKPAAPQRLEALALARKEFAALAPHFEPAHDMLSLVEARLNPTERIAALARRLDQEAFNEETPFLLNDYLVLLDQQPRTQVIDAREALTAWIGAMQADSPADIYEPRSSASLQAQRKLALDGLRKRWLAKPEALWLTPLLSLAAAGELSAAERKAAAAVPASHPLYLTLQYHLARLAIAEQQGARADADLERLLASQGKTLSVASSNRLLALKMLSASTMDAFLKAAPRRPDLIDSGEPIDATPAAASATDEDFRVAVFRFLPLVELKTLLRHPLLPKEFKAKLQESALARALILNDEASVLELLDAVAVGRKSTAHLYARYRSAKPGAERRLAGALLLVNTPELAPELIDKAGKNRYWGCSSGEGEMESKPLLATVPPRFLGAEQLAAAAKEQQTYLALPLRSEYIAPTLLDWVKTKPADPEAAKALHFLVASTRMECPYGTAKPEKEQMRATYSRQAYELLHRYYPNTSWAKDTKYYY